MVGCAASQRAQSSEGVQCCVLVCQNVHCFDVFSGASAVSKAFSVDLGFIFNVARNAYDLEIYKLNT